MSNDEGQGVEISTYQGPNPNARPIADVIYGVNDIVEVKPERESIDAENAPVAAVATNRTWLIVAMIIATISTLLIIPVKISVILSQFCLYCGPRPPAPEWYLPTIILLHGLGFLLYGYTWRKSRGPSTGCLNTSAVAGFYLNIVLLVICGPY